MERIKNYIETRAFGVCTYLGERFSISSNRIRLYFIYASFLTLGSPIILYFVMAFFLNIRRYMVERHRSVWDL